MNDSPSRRTPQRPARVESRSLDSYATIGCSSAGSGYALIGTWMTRVATSWLIYELTNQDWMLGIISFAGQIPILLVVFR